MKKLLIFDLDGVLVDTKDIHYNSLNAALRTCNYPNINHDEHLARFDGKSTNEKLRMLVEEDRINPTDVAQIAQRKKEFTQSSILMHIKQNGTMISDFVLLRAQDCKIAVASNAIRETVVACLERLGIINYVDYFVSNEDVKYHKPHPEIYWNCMTRFGATPANTLIVEDSAVGREAALASGAHVLMVDSSYHSMGWINPIFAKLSEIEKDMFKNLPWADTKMNVLIPMAGAGSRFAAQGYTFPKPLIEVRNKPMIQVVVENLNIMANYIFIVQKEHYEKYNLNYLLNLIAPNCKIVQVDGITEGAACTTLLAKQYIDSDDKLIIANSDQFIEWDANKTLYSLTASALDGGILTFKSTHPKWSFAKVDENGFVTEVAEKKPISDDATVGVYYWKHGKDYVKYAEQMIAANKRVNNEFYVAPTFNEAIADGKKFGIRQIENMWGIGTPEDLNYFLQNYKGLQ
jgi:HAD superfamily hydrolase (TIGR01509 family)